MELHLRPDADGESASQTVLDLENEAGNARSGEMYERYIAWTERAERMLPNVLEPEAVTELVHTSRYWMLRTAPPDTHRLPALVDAELEDRQQVMKQLRKTIDAERKRWRCIAATLVVPDTNVFLQQEHPVQDVDWLTVTDSRPRVRLVVPLVVIHELDRLKRQGNTSTAKLAREAIRWLAAVLPSNPADCSTPLSGEGMRSVTIEVAVQQGPTRPDDADGVIISFAQQLRSVSSMPTKLVTRDLGMHLRASTLGMDALLLQTSAAGDSDLVARSGGVSL